MALVAVLSFATVFIVCYVLLLSSQRTRVRVDSRVRNMAGQRMAASDSRQFVASLGARIPLRMRRTSATGSTWMQRLEVNLRRAEIDIAAREFAMRWVLIVACVSVALAFAFGIAAPLVFIAGGYIGTLLYIRARVGRRTRRINDGLHTVLILISNSLRAGQSFVQALHTVSQDAAGPLQEEFLRIEGEMQLGATLEDAFMRANERIGSDDFDLIVTAILIQRQVGGNLAEVLEKISDTIRDRVRLKREVKALTSQGRLSAGIFMILPSGIGIILWFMNPTYIGVLFQTPLGLLMLGMAGMGQLIGFFLIRRIVNVAL